MNSIGITKFLNYLTFKHILSCNDATDRCSHLSNHATPLTILVLISRQFFFMLEYKPIWRVPGTGLRYNSSHLQFTIFLQRHESSWLSTYMAKNHQNDYLYRNNAPLSKIITRPWVQFILVSLYFFLWSHQNNQSFHLTSPSSRIFHVVYLGSLLSWQVR